MYSTLGQDQPLSGRGQYEREAPEPAQPNDLTLGIPALLGIFFAIVTVCGLAFGFGYSFGHHGPKHAAASVAPAPPIQTSSAPPLQTAAQPTGAAPGPEASGAAKPSPSAAIAMEGPAPSPAATESAIEAPAENAVTRAVSSEPETMVQIAAVMHPADAEALATALRRDGYSAVVRTEPNDHFLHVQVGPFPTRDAARTMRARLQANGYSPILKP